jgi:hypothetical protein
VITTDEKNIITETPSYWNKFIGKLMDVLAEELGCFGKVSIHYKLNKRMNYEGPRNPKRPDGPEKRNRFGENRFGQTGGEGNRTLTPIREKSRIILRKRNSG